MAEWDTAYVNDLPDGSFLYVAPGGRKDGQGKTVPRSLRYFPYRNAQGNVDIPHARNAAARIPQSSLSAALKATLAKKIQAILDRESPARNRPVNEAIRRAAGR